MKVFITDQQVLLEVLGSFNFFREVDVKVLFWKFNYIYQFYRCLLQPDMIQDQSIINHVVFKEIIFLLNQCFDLVIKPRGALVISDYIPAWNEIILITIHDEITLIDKDQINTRGRIW